MTSILPPAVHRNGKIDTDRLYGRAIISVALTPPVMGVAYLAFRHFTSWNPFMASIFVAIPFSAVYTSWEEWRASRESERIQAVRQVHFSEIASE